VVQGVIDHGRRDLIYGALLAGTGIVASSTADATTALRKMTKILTAVARRPDMPMEQFIHEWTVVHADLGRSVKGVERFVANIVKLEPSRSDVPDMLAKGLIDGFAEVWFDSELLPQLGKTPEGKRWLAHGAQLFGSTHTFRVEEIVVW
jgi:hypothetical protein